jgi:predicted Zn-dependent protease
MLWLGLCHAAYAIPLIRDPEIEDTLRHFATPIFKEAGLKPNAVKIYIVNDDAINAFVAGGSNLFVHTGLILRSDTPDMLLGVIAHETGHIAGGHLARGAEKLKNAQIGTIFSYVLGAAAAVATGKPEAAGAVIAGGQNSAIRNFLSYTRVQEEAADQAALNYLDKLGISAQGMLKTFQLLQRQERLHASNPDPYLRSHPLSTSRIEHVRNHVGRSAIPEGQYPKSFELRHQRMVAKLYSFSSTPEQTLRKYPVNDASLPARMARAVAYYKTPNLDNAMAEMDTIIKIHPNDPFLHELKGQILFESGNIEEALSSYTTANKLLPGSALILTDLAKAELALARPAIASAVTHLEKATSLDNTNSFTWRLLATAYGKNGAIGMSNLALAEEAILNNKPEEALKKVDLALAALKKGTPARQRAEDVKVRAQKMQRDKKEMDSLL